MTVRLVARGSAFEEDPDTRRMTARFACLPRVGDELALDRSLPPKVLRVILLPQPQPDGAAAIVIHNGN